MQEARTVLLALLKEFERRGWRDDGAVGLDLALRLTADSTTAGRRTAATAVPRAFLDTNEAKRADLSEAIDAVITITKVTSTPLRRALVPVLFTDIVSSTETLEEVGDDEWRRRLDLHDELSKRVTADHGGTLIQQTGDGVLATFESATDAVRAAGNLVRALSEAGISVRAGVHAGDVTIRTSGNIAGTVVHAAQRVMAQAGSNEVFVSEAVRDLVSGAKFTFDDMGEYQLKGYRKPRRLFRLR